MIANLNIKVAGLKKCSCSYVICPFYHKRIKRVLSTSKPKFGRFVFEQCKRFGDKIEGKKRCGACKIAYPFGVWVKTDDIIP